MLSAVVKSGRAPLVFWTFERLRRVSKVQDKP